MRPSHYRSHQQRILRLRRRRSRVSLLVLVALLLFAAMGNLSTHAGKLLAELTALESKPTAEAIRGTKQWGWSPRSGSSERPARWNDGISAPLIQPTAIANYANTTVSLGANATVTPGAPPSGVTSINASTSTDFKGTLSANPTTGVVRVTNASPAGVYTVTVITFNGNVVVSTDAFALTVQSGAACSDVPNFGNANASDQSLGQLPTSLAVGDFNNDGRQDLAVVSIFDNNLAILLGDGAGGFTRVSPDIALGVRPNSVAIGDFNNDGKQDLAIATDDGSSSPVVLIRLGDGTGHFNAATSVPVGAGAQTVVVGDFNNDGRQDLAVATRFVASVSIRLGDGAGGFSAAPDVTLGGFNFPSKLAMGDFNNDGKQDLAIATGDRVLIRLGNGAGGFPTAKPDILTGLPGAVAIGDFNNDGKQDLAIATDDGGFNKKYFVIIRLGDGTGGFTNKPDVDTVSDAALAIGDFNNDGKQDLVTIGSKAGIRLGDGLGGFSGTINLDPAPGGLGRDVAIGDFNGDRKQDIAIANFSPNNVSILLRLGCHTPTITPVSGLSRPQGRQGPKTIANVTDDGGNGNVTVTVTSANPSNGVTISNIVNTAGTITANVKTDCAAASATFTLQANNGSSAVLATLTINVTPASAPTLSYADQIVGYSGSLNINPTSASVDGANLTVFTVSPAMSPAPTVDGNGVVSISNATAIGDHTITVTATDLCGAVTNASFVLTVRPTLGDYPNTTVIQGANTTVTPTTAPTNTTSISVYTTTSLQGRFTADPVTGKVFVTNAGPVGVHTITVTALNLGVVQSSKTFTLTVQPGGSCSGVPLFTQAASVSVGLTPTTVAVGDFNNDGKQDLAVANFDSNSVSIRLGNGSGGFTNKPDITADFNVTSVAIGDFNGDGKEDIAFTISATKTVAIRLGDGTGNFSGTTNITVSDSPRFLAIGDFNGDGNQDIAVTTEGNKIPILKGDGAGGFSLATEVTGGTRPTAIAIGAFNNSAKLDLVTSNDSSGDVSVLLNHLSGNVGDFSNAAGSPIGGAGRPASVSVGDFNGDGKQDLAVAWNNIQVKTLLGNGTGVFTDGALVSVGIFPSSVAIGDYNGDGKQDLAVPNANGISLLLGNGADGFRRADIPLQFQSNPASGAVGDFNGDGFLDLAISSSNSISILLGGGCNPAPTITAATGLSRQQSSASSNSTIATVSDNDGNGDVAVTVASANPSNGVTLSNIVNTAGTITADIVADCGATNATFTLAASDVFKSTSTGTVTVSVIANSPPTLSYSNKTVHVDSITINPATGPSDNGAVSSIKVWDSGGIATADMSVDNSTGVISISHAIVGGNLVENTHHITIRATDNCGAITDATFTLIGLSPNTAPGCPSTVSTSDANITFGCALQYGFTEFTAISPSSAGTVPNGYTLCPTCPAYDITTTAVYTAPVTACLAVPSSISSTVYATLKLLHGENGNLVDRTTSHFTDGNGQRWVCGSVNSLSPFVLGGGTSPTAADGTISGHVADLSGAPIAGVSINLSGAEERLAITDANGNYHFDDLEANGFFTITPSRTNYSFNPMNRSFSLLGAHVDASFVGAANGRYHRPLDMNMKTLPQRP